MQLGTSYLLLGRDGYEADPSGVLHQMQDPLEIVMFGSTLVNLGIIRWFEPLLLLVFWFIKELVSGHLLHIVILKCHSVTRPANALPDSIGGVTLTSVCQNKCHSANRLPDLIGEACDTVTLHFGDPAWVSCLLYCKATFSSSSDQ